MVTAQSLPQVLLVHTGLDAGAQHQLGQAFSMTTLDLREWRGHVELADQLNLLGEQLPQLQMVIIADPWQQQRLNNNWITNGSNTLLSRSLPLPNSRPIA